MRILYRNWFIHHTVGHPAMAIFELVLFMPKVGGWFHDVTLPIGEYHDGMLEQ